MATNGDAEFSWALQTTQRVNARSNLRARMFQAGISQAELAKAADMNEGTVAAAMRSGRNVKALTLNKLLIGYNDLVVRKGRPELRLDFEQMFPPHIGGYDVNPGRIRYRNDDIPTRPSASEGADDGDLGVA